MDPLRTHVELASLVLELSLASGRRAHVRAALRCASRLGVGWDDLCPAALLHAVAAGRDRVAAQLLAQSPSMPMFPEELRAAVGRNADALGPLLGATGVDWVRRAPELLEAAIARDAEAAVASDAAAAADAAEAAAEAAEAAVGACGRSDRAEEGRKLAHVHRQPARARRARSMPTTKLLLRAIPELYSVHLIRFTVMPDPDSPGVFELQLWAKGRPTIATVRAAFDMAVMELRELESCRNDLSTHAFFGAECMMAATRWFSRKRPTARSERRDRQCDMLDFLAALVGSPQGIAIDGVMCNVDLAKGSLIARLLPTPADPDQDRSRTSAPAASAAEAAWADALASALAWASPTYRKRANATWLALIARQPCSSTLILRGDLAAIYRSPDGESGRHARDADYVRRAVGALGWLGWLVAGIALPADAPRRASTRKSTRKSTDPSDPSDPSDAPPRRTHPAHPTHPTSSREIAVVRGGEGRVENVLVRAAGGEWRDVVDEPEVRPWHVIYVFGYGCSENDAAPGPLGMSMPPSRRPIHTFCNTENVKVAMQIAAAATSCDYFVRNSDFVAKVRDRIVDLLASDPDSDVLVLGHSYGGAAAIFAAKDAVAKGGDGLAGRIRVATFGSIVVPPPEAPGSKGMDMHHYMHYADTATICNGLRNLQKRADVTWVRSSIGRGATRFRIADRHHNHISTYKEIMLSCELHGTTRVRAEDACLPVTVDVRKDAIPSGCEFRYDGDGTLLVEMRYGS